MKQIYLVLTDTGTALSKIIRIFMRDEYAHISLSLDRELRHMYSFGRLNPYNPFLGGFVHESMTRGTFKRFKNTKAKIVSLNVDEMQYKKLKNILKYTKQNRREFKFNVLGLFGIYFNFKRKKDKYFYCAEYIKYIIEYSDIDLNLPEMIRPENFKEIKNSKIEYIGLLREYKDFLEESVLDKAI